MCLYEQIENVLSAIEREKQIKKYNRTKKFELITHQKSSFQELTLEV